MLRPPVVVLLLVVATLVVRLVPAWLLAVEVADILTYRVMALAILRGDSVYAVPVLFPYPPYSQFEPAAMLRLADLTGWRFDFTVKLPCILADGVATWLIYHYLRWRGASLGSAAAWTAGFAFNPVSILISAFHGNLMASVPTILFAAFVLVEHAERSPERARLVLAGALTLGIGIAIRPYAVPVVPVFALLATRSIVGAVAFGAVTTIPSLLSMVPYLILERQTLLRAMFTYSGFTDFGWVAALRALPYFTTGVKPMHFDDAVVEGTKRLYIVGYGALLPLIALFDRERLRSALLLGYLLFYGLYGNVSAQYFVWVLPFALALRMWMIVPYTLLATLAIACFYVLYHPSILFGRYPPLVVESPEIVTRFVIADVGLVALSLAWAAWIVVDGLRHVDVDGLVPVTARRFGLSLRTCRAGLATLSAVAGLIWLGSAVQIGLRANEVVRSFLR